MTVITRRGLNRALLDRQSLLRRNAMPAQTALEHLVGLQAQAALAPYVGLWSRLTDFQPAELAHLLRRREAVRMPLMRATIHLVSREDAIALRPVVQPVLERKFRSSPFGRNLQGIDFEELATAARALLRAPLTRSELGRELARLWPERDPLSLAYAGTYLLPVVQVPPRGIWGEHAQATWMAADAWLGDDVPELGTALETTVLRYLAAFGPAAVEDVVVWSGLIGMRAVVESLRPRLRIYRSEDGRELFDVEEAPLPDPDAPAPPRYLPEYDNVLLSHRNRDRIIEGDRKPPLLPGEGASKGTVLIDGFMRATWKVEHGEGATVLTVQPFSPLNQDDIEAVVDEGERLLQFIGPHTTGGRVRIDV